MASNELKLPSYSVAVPASKDFKPASEIEAVFIVVAASSSEMPEVNVLVPSKVLTASISAAVVSNVATKEVNASVGVESVVISATGVVTVTLDDKYNALLHASVVSVGSATVDNKFVVVSEDVANSKVVVFQNVEGAAAADIDDCSILIKFELKNTSVSR